VLFPLGDITKREVRAIARREGIPRTRRKDSTGICFIGERPFRDFLARYLPRKAGPMRRRPVVGEHRASYYTLGQRQGLRIGGTRDGSDAPWFVARQGGTAHMPLVVVQGHDHPLLYNARGRSDRHALDRGALAGVSASRGRQDALPDGRAECMLASASDRYVATFREPQWAPTPGQISSPTTAKCALGGVIAASGAVQAQEVEQLSRCRAMIGRCACAGS
jgi:tRNA-specific 2-thiouridylase